MSIRVDKVQLEIEVREHRRDAEIVKLNKDLGEAGRKYRSLQNEVDKLSDKLKQQEKVTEAEANELKELESQLEKAKIDYQRLDQQKTEYVRKNKLETMTIYELSQEYRSYQQLLRNLDPNSEYYEKTQKYLQALKGRMAELNIQANNTKTSLERFMDKANSFGFAITNALAIKDRIVSWADQYVQSFAKIDDAMTDVMKYTNQSKAEVEEMNETFKKMTTRTPREELNALAGAAGRLGIQGKKDIEGFVDAADKINVALGDDLGEGAIDQIGKLTMVFGDDKKKGLQGAMLATGSAVNELGANSSANTGFIVEFTNDVAAMAAKAGIAQTDIMGYASALSQAGIDGKVASGVFAQLVTKMFVDPAKFARAAKLDVQAFTELLNKDANAAILQFVEAMQRAGGFAQLAPMLKELKMQGTNAIPVLAGLAGKMTELRDAQNLAKKAYEEGTSIVKEFNNANSSAAAKLEMAQQAMNDVAAELGQKLMPIVENGIKLGTLGIKAILQIMALFTKYAPIVIALTTAITALTIAEYGHIAAEKLMEFWTGKVKVALVGLLNVTKAHPFILLASAITGLVVAFNEWYNSGKRIIPIQERLNLLSRQAEEDAASETRRLQTLVELARSKASNDNQRKGAIEELNKIAPEYLGFLNSENIMTAQADQAIKDYTQSILLNCQAKRLAAQIDDVQERKRNAKKKLDDGGYSSWMDSFGAATNSILNGLSKIGNATESFLSRGSFDGWNAPTALEQAGFAFDTAHMALNGFNNDMQNLSKEEAAYNKELDNTVKKLAELSGKKAEPDTVTSPTITEPGGLSDKEISADRKKMKEEEDLAKAHYDQELLRIKAFYGLRKNLGDEQKQAEFNAEKQYLEKMAKIRAEHQSTEAEKQEVYNKALDLTIKESNHNYEKLQRELNTKLQQEDYEFQQKQIEAAQRRFNNEYQSDEVYNQQLEQLEIEHQKRIVEIKKAGGQNASAEEKRLLDLQLQQRKKQQQQQQQDLATFQKGNNELLHQDMAGESMKEQLRLNQEAYDQQLISLEQFEQNKDMIVEEHAQKRQEIQQAAMDGVNNLMSSASQLFSAMQQRETSQVEAKYKKQIAAAKKNGKDTTKLEEQMEAEKAAIAKKYADRNFKIQVLQIIASTAAGIAKTIAELGMPWAIPFVAMAAAAGAMQLASAKAAADQAAGLYEGGYSDEYQEGYTAKGDPRKQAGVIPVHRNEFVANHKAVANPEVRPVLDVIDRHQKRGDISMLNSTRMLEEAYGRGRYRGGYSSEPEEKRPDGDSADNTRTSNGEMLEILRRIEDNTADSLTVKELRDAIRRQERLEQNARR